MGLKSDTFFSEEGGEIFAPCMGLKSIASAICLRVAPFAPCMGLKRTFNVASTGNVAFAPYMGL